MIYLISQVWANTDGNHAGMKHMCDLLNKTYPNRYRSFSLPDDKTSFISKSTSKLERSMRTQYYDKFLRRFRGLRILLCLF